MAGTNPNQPSGNWHYEWREISNPYADFNQTKLYDVLTDFFSQLGHTHQKSDITDFSHTHSPSDVTGLGTWETVSTSISGVTLYVNQALRLVEFNYDMNSYSFVAGYNAIGTLPSTYIPKTHITLSLRSGIQYGYVDKDDMKIYIHNNGAGTANVHASGMWHY